MKKLLCAAAFVFALVVSGSGSAADPSDWVAFSPSGEKFSIAFPSTPLSQVQQVPTIAGKVRMKMFQDQDGPVTYLLGVLEIPQDVQQVLDSPETALDAFALGFVKGLPRSKLISQKKITVGAHKGLELKVSVFGGAGIARCQVLLTGDRLYAMMVAAPAAKDVSAEAEAFFGSFQLKETRGGL